MAWFLLLPLSMVTNANKQMMTGIGSPPAEKTLQEKIDWLFGSTDEETKEKCLKVRAWRAILSS